MASKKEQCKRGHLLNQFRAYKKGGGTYCKACRILVSREYRKKDSSKEKARIQAQTWRSKNKEKAYLVSIKSHLKVNYNLTLESVQKLLLQQNNECAICDKQLTYPNGHKTHIDHCHTTGKIRGILCSKCNTSIGVIEANFPIFEKIENYLRVSLLKPRKPSSI